MIMSNLNNNRRIHHQSYHISPKDLEYFIHKMNLQPEVKSCYENIVEIAENIFRSKILKKETTQKDTFDLPMTIPTKFDDKNNLQVNTVDLNSSLFLGQFIVCKLLNRKKSLKNIHMVSGQEGRIGMNKYISVNLTFVRNSFIAKNGFNEFTLNYKGSQKWYQNIFKDVLEEISSKKFQRNQERLKNRNLPERIFENSMWIFKEKIIT